MALYNINPGAYRGFVAFFQQYASNNALNKHDLRGVLAKYNITATNDELQQMIDSISVDTSGIGLQAFLDYLATWVGFRDLDQEYVECFRVFDRSGSGKLSKEDIIYVMNKLGNGKFNVDNLLKEYGTKENIINYEGFLQMMKKF